MHTKLIILYIILYNTMWLISIAMCYLHRFIDNTNYDIQDFLIILFEFLARIVLVIGATRTIPVLPYSNYRVWFYYIIMGGSLAAVNSFINLTSIIHKLLL